ncbi:unnamed protein product [Tilletia caries]|nr:unnamed protein product [Tilletia caries]
MEIDVRVVADGRERQQLRQELSDHHGLAGCVGFIDGTHVNFIGAPARHDAADFFNRHHMHSYNILAVVDYNLRFCFLHLGFPGSAHDQRVYRASALAQNPDHHFSKDEFILSDSGYTSDAHLVSLFRRFRGQSSVSAAQIGFNQHASCRRVLVEHAFELLKLRWQSLRALPISLKDALGEQRAACWIWALEASTTKPSVASHPYPFPVPYPSGSQAAGDGTGGGDDPDSRKNTAPERSHATAATAVPDKARPWSKLVQRWKEKKREVAPFPTRKRKSGASIKTRIFKSKQIVTSVTSNRPKTKLASQRFSKWLPVSSSMAARATRASSKVMRDVALAGYAAGTVRNYSTALAQWHRYCDEHKIPEKHREPAAAHLVEHWVAMQAGTKSGSYLSDWISGIKAWHTVNDLPWLPKEERLALIRRGVLNLQPDPRPPREPMTVEWLDTLTRAAKPGDPLELAVIAAAATGFWGLCRLGELVTSSDKEQRQYNITRAHVVQSVTFGAVPTFTLKLPRTKTMPTGETVVIAHQNETCDPVRLLSQHLELSPCVNQKAEAKTPLFAYRGTGKLIPLSRTKFLSTVGAMAKRAGINGLHGHSMRIGGCTTLLTGGVPPERVMLHGRWSSDAFKRYIREHAAVMTPYLVYNQVAADRLHRLYPNEWPLATLATNTHMGQRRRPVRTCRRTREDAERPFALDQTGDADDREAQRTAMSDTRPQSNGNERLAQFLPAAGAAQQSLAPTPAPAAPAVTAPSLAAPVAPAAPPSQAAPSVVGDTAMTDAGVPTGVLLASPEVQKILGPMLQRHKNFDVNAFDSGTGEDGWDVTVVEPDVNVSLMSCGVGKVECRVSGMPITAIIDSGSEINVISRSACERLRLPLTTYNSSMRTADGRSSSLNHIVRNVDVNCGGVVARIHLHVIENCTYELLLGRPWQRTVRCINRDADEGLLITIHDPVTTATHSFIAFPSEQSDPRSSYRLSVHDVVREVSHLLCEDELGRVLRREDADEEQALLARERTTRTPAHQPSVLAAYKPVARKVRSVAENITEHDRVQVNIPPDYEDDMIKLPSIAPPLQPGKRLTLERLAELKLDPDGLLLPDEMDLLKWVLVSNEMAMAFDESEKGVVDPAIVPPVTIPVTEHELWNMRNIPVPAAIKEKVLGILKSKIDSGLYEASSAGYTSRWLAVMKKVAGDYRIVHDLQPLNGVTKRIPGRLPQIDQFVGELSGKACIGSLDHFSGFDQVWLAVESRDLTTFETELGRLRHTRLPQGGTNSCVVFHFIVVAIVGPDGKVYVDDTFIPGPDSTYDDEPIPDNPNFRRFIYEYLTKLHRVLFRIGKAGMTVSARKMAPIRRTVEVLGQEVSPEGRRVSKGKVDAVLKWTRCSSVSEVRSFIGLAGQARAWVPDYLLLIQPLTQLTRKGVSFHWGPEQQAAMDEVKRIIAERTCLVELKYSDDMKPIQLGVDAGPLACGFWLGQENDEEVIRVARYGSLPFNEREQGYSQAKRELYAVFRALKYFRHWLWGTRVIVRTDAGFVKGMLANPELPNSAMVRWLAYILLFDLEVLHVKAKDNAVADGLSRRPVQPDDDAVTDDDGWITAKLNDSYLRIGLDITYLPKALGQRYLVVARDDLSGWVEARALRHKSSRSVARFLVKDVFTRHGLPIQVTTDQGTEFKGVVDELLNKYKIDITRTSVYNPRANGAVERGHPPLKEAIVHAARTLGAPWPEVDSLACWIDRTSIRRQYGASPFSLLHAHEPVLPIDLSSPELVQKYAVIKDDEDALLAAIAERVARLGTHKELLELARKSKSTDRERAVARRNLQESLVMPSFQPGQLVLVRNFKGISSHEAEVKLQDNWVGPFKVLWQTINGGVWMTTMQGTALPSSIHPSHVKLYRSRIRARLGTGPQPEE